MNGFTKCVVGGAGALALAGDAAAQQPSLTTTIPPHPLLKPVGTRLPQAVPSAGTPIGMIPGGRMPGLNPGNPAAAPNKPPGQVIDMRNVIAPYPGQPEPPPTFWQELERRWFSMFQSDAAPPERMPYTPGIARRNQERREARMGRWQRD